MKKIVFWWYVMVRSLWAVVNRLLVPMLAALTVAVTSAQMPVSDPLAPCHGAGATRLAPVRQKPGTTTLVATRGLPYVRIDRRHGFVDVDATVVFNPRLGQSQTAGAEQPAGDWLELVACTPGGREYESLLAVRALPSHIHQALLMIGLIPGSPMRTRLVDGKFHITGPCGPRVDVSIVMRRCNKAFEIPISQWVINQRTQRPLVSSEWLFTGSTFRRIQDREVYLADLNGTAISLVNFGDDLLSRATTMTNQNDQQTWAVNRGALPPLGTPVVVRLRALDRPLSTTQTAAPRRGAAATHPATQPRSSRGKSKL